MNILSDLLRDERIQLLILFNIAPLRHQHRLQVPFLDPVLFLPADPNRLQDPLLNVPLNRALTHLHSRSYHKYQILGFSDNTI